MKTYGYLLQFSESEHELLENAMSYGDEDCEITYIEDLVIEQLKLILKDGGGEV